MRLHRFRLLLLLALAGCQRETPPHADAQRTSASVAASSAAQARTAASAQAPSASSVAAPSSPSLDCGSTTAIQAAGQLLSAWNNALNAHDADALSALYAPSVSFYGRERTASEVIAAKRVALAAAPSFRQQLADVQLSPEPEHAATATFSKTSLDKSVRSRLQIRCAASGKYAIDIESDAPSDALAQRHEDCETAMSAVASALPLVKSTLARGTADTPAGGIWYPVEGKHFSLSLGFHHPERFESVFFVDWLNGAFTVASGVENLAVPAAGIARVRAACPR